MRLIYDAIKMITLLAALQKLLTLLAEVLLKTGVHLIFNVRGI